MSAETSSIWASAGGRPSFPDRIQALPFIGHDILALSGVKVYRGGTDNALIHCPAPDHEDRCPSCSVNLERGSAHCFACGWRTGDLVGLHRALGCFATMGEALKDLEARAGLPVPRLTLRRAPSASRRDTSAPNGRPITVNRWTYQEADGTHAFDVVRIQFMLPDGSWEMDAERGKPRKTYRPVLPGRNRTGLPSAYKDGTLRPLYRRPKLSSASADESVWIVEGEPAADALSDAGFLVTTSSGGAGSAARTDWRPLTGRHVIVWPDNDDAGKAYADEVIDLLRRLDPLPHIERLDIDQLSLPPGGDAVDWLRKGQDAAGEEPLNE